MQGIGNDIIEIERIESSIKEYKEKFLNRIFTKKELEYCSKYKDAIPHFAARFAAKEAIAKALGVGIGKTLAWHDMEILNNQEGKPEVFFSEKAKATFSNPQVLLSMSHCKAYATAVALYQKG